MKLTTTQLKKLIKETIESTEPEPTPGYYDALAKLEAAYNAVSSLDHKKLRYNHNRELRGWTRHIRDSIWD